MSVRAFAANTITPRLLLLLVCASAIAGCDKGSNSAEVDGEVNFDGKPLASGRIYFNPDYTKGPDGPQGYAEIKDGKFDTRKGGKAAFGGPTIVVIQASEIREFQQAMELPKSPSKQNFDVPASAAKDAPKAPEKGPPI